MNAVHEPEVTSLEDLNLDFEIPCEVSSVPQMDHDPESHPADWAVLKSCGCTSNICDFIYQSRFQMPEEGVATWCIRCETMPITLLRAIPLRSHGS